MPHLTMKKQSELPHSTAGLRCILFVVHKTKWRVEQESWKLIVQWINCSIFPVRRAMLCFCITKMEGRCGPQYPVGLLPVSPSTYVEYWWMHHLIPWDNQFEAMVDHISCWVGSTSKLWWLWAGIWLTSRIFDHQISSIGSGETRSSAQWTSCGCIGQHCTSHQSASCWSRTLRKTQECSRQVKLCWLH